MPIEILAHRTGMAHAPENSLDGFSHCYRNGAVGVECDVTFIEEEAYVWARGTLEKTPHLKVDDVLEFVADHPGMRIYFDVKYYDHHLTGHFASISDRLIELSRQHIMLPAGRRGIIQRIGFVTFCGGARLLSAAKTCDPNIATDLMVIFPWTRIGKYADYLDAITIGWDGSLGNHWEYFPRQLRSIIIEARAGNIEIRGGLANSVEEIRWLIEQGMDGVWTDDVFLPRLFSRVSIAIKQ